jgi:hypothetical protein
MSLLSLARKKYFLFKKLFDTAVVRIRIPYLSRPVSDPAPMQGLHKLFSRTNICLKMPMKISCAMKS